MTKATKDGENGRIRKRARANSMGQQWWRKLALPRRGKKDTLLSPCELSETQGSKLKRRREKLRKALVAPRSARLKHMAVADWDEVEGMARIIQQKGNAMQSMGIFENGVQKLFPEEALFLVDKGCMDLRRNGVPMSFQHAWTVLFSSQNSRSFEEYLAFVHLRRAGYVVRRYEAENEQDSKRKSACCSMNICFSAWRVGAFKRKDLSRPLFHLAVFRYAEMPPRIRDVCAFLESTGKTRVKIALIDRGVVVLTDVASNATPLSDRFRKRFEKCGTVNGNVTDVNAPTDDAVLAETFEKNCEADGRQNEKEIANSR